MKKSSVTNQVIEVQGAEVDQNEENLEKITIESEKKEVVQKEEAVAEIDIRNLTENIDTLYNIKTFIYDHVIFICFLIFYRISTSFVHLLSH